VLDRVRAADGLATCIDPDLPVIVLTGRAAEADRVRSFQRGADDHVSKPSCRFRGVESRWWSGQESRWATRAACQPRLHAAVLAPCGQRRRQVPAARDAELAIDPCELHLDRAPGEEEGFGDFTVATTAVSSAMGRRRPRPACG
jgi:CheY-like chemotaxis protein